MIGFSRVSSTVLRAAEMILPVARTAQSTYQSSAVTMPAGKSRQALELDITLADRQDPSAVVTIENEVSLDAGQSWIPWGAATSTGSATRPSDRTPSVAFPAPPEGALVRQRVTIGAQAVTCGHVARYV